MAMRSNVWQRLPETWLVIDALLSPLPLERAPFVGRGFRMTSHSQVLNREMPKSVCLVTAAFLIMRVFGVLVDHGDWANVLVVII